MRRVLIVLALAVAALPTGLWLPASADPAPIATLGVGDSAFWDGPFVENAGVSTRDADSLLCRGALGNMHACARVPGATRLGAETVAGVTVNGTQECEAPGCLLYELDLVEEGARLRVALDHPDDRDAFQVKLFAPSGQFAIADASLTLAFTPDPAQATRVLSPEGCEVEPAQPQGTLTPAPAAGICHTALAAATNVPAEFTSAPIAQPLVLGSTGTLVLHIDDPANPGRVPRCEFFQLHELIVNGTSRTLWGGTLCSPPREGRNEFRFRLSTTEVPAGSRLRVRLQQWDFQSQAARWLFGGENYGDAGITLTTGHIDANGQPTGAPELLLPNLKATPPFDLVFGGCQASEIVQYNPGRCLRMSAGPANVGKGPVDLRIAEAGATSGINWQWIHRSDGSVVVRPAGTFEWHAEHLHYHHVGTGNYRLYRVVDDESGELTPAGQGPKVGFCMGDYLIAEWESFEQDLRGSGSGNCYQAEAGLGDAPLGTRMGLSRGWGDIYAHYVEGNYVDFGANPDGLYVVRVATDASNTIAELIEDDNHGYAYIRVTGDHIDVLERGYGLSPWDPAKVIADDLRNPTV